MNKFLLRFIMKRTNYIIATLTAVIFFTACDKEEFELKQDYYNAEVERLSIALDDQYKEFDENEHFINAQFESNFWWNAEVKLINEDGDYETEGWFSMTPLHNFGSREINIYLSQNVEKSHDRKVEITFTSEDNSYTNTLTIVQRAARPFIELSEQNKSFSVLGGQANILVNTSELWKISDLPPWITVDYDNASSFIKGRKILMQFNVEPYTGVDNEDNREYSVVFESLENGSTATPQTLHFIQARMAKSPDGVTVENGDEDLIATWNSVIGTAYYEVLAYDLNGNFISSMEYDPQNPDDPTQSCSLMDMNWGSYVGKIDLTVRSYLSDVIWRESTKGVAFSHNYFSNDSGDGSDDAINVLKIYNVRHLENVHHSLASDRYLYYKQMADIDLGYYKNNTYSPIGSIEKPFKGSFDGNGFSIKNLSYQNSRKILYNDSPFYYGVFGVVDSFKDRYDEDADIEIHYDPTVIANVTIKDFNILAEDASTAVLDGNRNYCAVGHLAGRVNGGAKIQDCTVQNSLLQGGGATTRNFLGGFVGMSDYANISNCRINGGYIKFGRGGAAGGIVGHSINELTLIENCTNNIDYFNTSIAATYGGILGRGVGTIKKCVNHADMRLTMFTGGIVGHTSYYLDGGSLKAGIIIVKDCVNYGSYQQTANIDAIDNTNNNAASGGIVGITGAANNEISGCVNYGNLVNHANKKTASIVGYSYGGIVGNGSNINITNCVNHGFMSGTIWNEVQGNITVYAVGGIAGRLNINARSIIVNSYNTGSIVYATGGANEAKTTINAGALCGLFSGIPTNTNVVESFGLSGLANSTTKLLGSKDLNEGNTSSFKTEAELKNPATFAAWDNAMWLIQAGAYPTLKNIPATN
ncbi:hypothetical protein MASR2M117_00130 [Paludibacter sp.]